MKEKEIPEKNIMNPLKGKSILLSLSLIQYKDEIKQNIVFKNIIATIKKNIFNYIYLK